MILLRITFTSDEKSLFTTDTLREVCVDLFEQHNSPEIIPVHILKLY